MKNTVFKIVCLILALAMAVSAFAACKGSGDDIVSSSQPASSDENVSSEPTDQVVENPSSEEEPTDEPNDEWIEELPTEEEEEIYYENLYVNNTKKSPTYFRGISYIHQMASYYTDKFGRLYTDEQREYELGLMKEMGVKNIVYTDISKDGMLMGPNVAMTQELTDKTGMNIIASGGVSSMEDLRNLNNAGIKGAIIGKAIYENRVTVKEAVDEFEK